MTKNNSSVRHPHAHVALSDIVDSDLYSLHSFQETDEIPISFRNSLKRFGVLVPPIVVARATGDYQLVCGRKRKEVVQKFLAQEEIFCRILPSHISRETLLDFILEDQLRAGSLTIIEQSFFLKICHDLLPQTSRRLTYLNRLPAESITKGKAFLESLQTLPSVIQNGLHGGKLAETTISTLKNITEADQMQLYYLFQSLHLSKSGQKKIAQGLYEIMKREEINLTDLLLLPEFDAILQQSHLTAGQQSEKFLAILEKRLYPRLAKATTSFNKEIEKLQLPESHTVWPSKNFERDEVYLTIRFSSLTELKEYLTQKQKPLAG